MKPLSLKKTMAALAAIPFVALADPAAAADETAPPQAQTLERGTMVLTTDRPQIDPANHSASFLIDINPLGIGGKIRLLAAKRTALIFDGSDSTQNKLCPFFNLEARPYKIKEIQKNVYRVTTPVSPAEIKQVESTGCAVTTAPDRKKIEYLP